MENLKELIQQYIPNIEEFLTSVLLEETTIDIVSEEKKEIQALEEDCLNSDIFICTRDENAELDFIVVLDKVWFGLLSSIMLGVEEKTNNEITRDLLQKFSKDLLEAIRPKFEEDGIQLELSDIQILTKTLLLKELSHSEYVRLNLEVDGLADHKVRAELLIGDPEMPREAEESSEEAADAPSAQNDTETQQEQEEDSASESTTEEQAGQTDEFKKTGPHTEAEGIKEEVITARSVEFEEFLDHPETATNGDSRNMDLLKNVELDLSVELGRIELPLGKVLQLSKGSVIELEKLAGEPVDILVNGHYIAKGEVVVIDEHFGVRISSLVTTKQKIAGMS